MRYVLNWLLDHRDKAVGAYYGNARMKKADKDHQPITKECGDRSGETEGIVSMAKKETILNRRLPMF